MWVCGVFLGGFFFRTNSQCFFGLVGGSLHDAITEKEEQGEYFRVPELRDLLLQVSMGLKYIHSSGLVHLDIKPSELRVSFVVFHMPLPLNEKFDFLTGTYLNFHPFQVIFSSAVDPARVLVERETVKKRMKAPPLGLYIKLVSSYLSMFSTLECTSFQHIQVFSDPEGLSNMDGSLNCPTIE